MVVGVLRWRDWNWSLDGWCGLHGGCMHIHKSPSLFGSPWHEALPLGLSPISSGQVFVCGDVSFRCRRRGGPNRETKSGEAGTPWRDAGQTDIWCYHSSAAASRYHVACQKKKKDANLRFIAHLDRGSWHCPSHQRRVARQESVDSVPTIVGKIALLLLGRAWRRCHRD